MSEEVEPGLTRMQLAALCINQAIQTMVEFSLRGNTVSPRFHMTILVNRTEPIDLLGSVHSITDLASIQIPTILPIGEANTEAAFKTALTYLQHYLPGIQDCPAPMICNLTTLQGRGLTPNLIAIASEIKSLITNDGPVLIQNIYLGNDLLAEPVMDACAWRGILAQRDLSTPTSRLLYNISSPLPPFTQDDPYHVPFDEGIKMFMPALPFQLFETMFSASLSTYKLSYHS